jgi:hypothetical protein
LDPPFIIKYSFTYNIIYLLYKKVNRNTIYFKAFANILSLFRKSIQKAKKALAKCENLWYNYTEEICVRGKNDED